MLSGYDSQTSLVICVARRKRRIPFSDIVYLRSEGRQIHLYTLSEEYVFYAQLNEVQTRLPAELFLRSHQSYLVNIDYVSEVGTELRLISGDVLPIRTRKRPQILDTFYRMATSRSLETGTVSPAILKMGRRTTTRV